MISKVPMVGSQQPSEMFDSWIQNQAYSQDKENFSYNSVKKQESKPLCSSKRMQNDNMILSKEDKSKGLRNAFQNGSYQGQRNSNQQIKPKLVGNKNSQKQFET